MEFTITEKEFEELKAILQWTVDYKPSNDPRFVEWLSKQDSTIERRVNARNLLKIFSEE